MAASCVSVLMNLALGCSAYLPGNKLEVVSSQSFVAVPGSAFVGTHLASQQPSHASLQPVAGELVNPCAEARLFYHYVSSVRPIVRDEKCDDSKQLAVANLSGRRVTYVLPKSRRTTVSPSALLLTPPVHIVARLFLRTLRDLAGIALLT